MNDMKMNIWGRDFTLRVNYDSYEGEDVNPIQIQAADEFSKYCDQMLDSCRKNVEKYIITESSNELSEVDNIFRYVIPTTVFYPHVQKKRTVAILCDFRFDIEHGLAIVFEEEKFKEIGPQDIVL